MDGSVTERRLVRVLIAVGPQSFSFIRVLGEWSCCRLVLVRAVYGRCIDRATWRVPGHRGDCEG